MERTKNLRMRETPEGGDALPEHTAIAAEARFPKPVAQDRQGMAALEQIVLRREHASQRRSDTQHGKVIAGHDLACDAFGTTGETQAHLHFAEAEHALKSKVAQQQIASLSGRRINGATVLAERLEGLDPKQLRTVVDTLRNKWGSAVILIASQHDSGISLISAVSKDLTSKVQAGKLVGEVAKAIGGKGGGRPDMAEGAGKDASRLPAALENVYVTVGALLQ